MKHTTTQFDFSAKPKVSTVKPKYRNRDPQQFDGTNLMNDPRIVRGNTYAAIIANKNQINPPPVKKVTNSQSKKQKNKKINFDTGFQSTTPRPLLGREHFIAQTQPFVETLRDKPIQYERQCQTDLFLDRPVERLFNPMDGKIGFDRQTQIQENDPQLFNFDFEVKPILDALLSKVIETSRMELFEEEELNQIELQKINYEKRRHAQLVQAQKLEAGEDRLQEQSKRRCLQYHSQKQQRYFLEKKVIGRIIAKQYLSNLRENTSLILDYQGFYRHPLEIDFFKRFLPYLYSEIHHEIKQKQQFSNLSRQIVMESTKQMLLKSQESINLEKQRRQKVRKYKMEALEKIIDMKKEIQHQQTVKKEENQLKQPQESSNDVE